MSQTYRMEIIGGFAVAVRQGQFSRQRDAPLAESTVSDTLNHVAVVFRENGHDDPNGMPSATLHDFYGVN